MERESRKNILLLAVSSKLLFCLTIYFERKKQLGLLRAEIRFLPLRKQNPTLTDVGRMRRKVFFGADLLSPFVSTKEIPQRQGKEGDRKLFSLLEAERAEGRRCAMYRVLAPLPPSHRRISKIWTRKGKEEEG